MSYCARYQPTGLPAEVPKHKEHGDQWHREGRCVTCGGKKARREYYHCEACYAAMFPSIFDYDDD